MLGWDARTDHASGAGVASYGLAKALVGHGVDVLYVLPRPASGKAAVPQASVERKTIAAVGIGEVQRALMAAVEHAAEEEACDEGAGKEMGEGVEMLLPYTVPEGSRGVSGEGAEVRVVRRSVELRPLDVLLSPYLTARQYHQVYLEHVEQMRVAAGAEAAYGAAAGHGVAKAGTTSGVVERWAERAIAAGASGEVGQPARVTEAGESAKSNYIDDLFEETKRYAQLAMGIGRKEKFSVVHAHDWMTFEAAMAVAEEHGVPLVVQMHSTELDRAGGNANGAIMGVEHEGMHGADVVIAVSYLMKTQLIEKYGVDPQKIQVVYSAAAQATEGVGSAGSHPPTPPTAIAGSGERGALQGGSEKRHADRVVLFLGRLTEQKGPDYFLQAARKVLEVEKRVKFVLAGGGEMAEALMGSAEEMGIARHVVFTGFLKKREVEKVLQVADVYVMPSLSEPFGLASLEAMNHDVPVIISKQSGVAELLRHVLKVDFWDTQDLANKIVAVLRHPSLGQTLREEGKSEVRLLTWEDSARRVCDMYEGLTAR